MGTSCALAAVESLQADVVGMKGFCAELKEAGVVAQLGALTHDVAELRNTAGMPGAQQTSAETQLASHQEMVLEVQRVNNQAICTEKTVTEAVEELRQMKEDLASRSESPEMKRFASEFASLQAKVDSLVVAR